jgi:hypothetical protein
LHHEVPSGLGLSYARFYIPKHHLLCYDVPQREGANMSKNQANQSHLPGSGFGAAIESELAVLASIEARYAHELTRLESSGRPPSVKEHLRQQLDARRKMARRPHVLRLAELYAEAQTRELFSRNTRH